MKKTAVIIAFSACVAATTAQTPTHNAPTISRVMPIHEPKAHAPLSKQCEAETYNITILLAEDFDKFTEGEVGSPHPTPFDGYIPSEYTSSPLWAAYYVYQAGGCALVDQSKNIDANLCTPILDIPINDMPVTVTFKARLGDTNYEFDYPTVWMVDATDLINPRTFTSDYSYSYDEWREYRFVLDKPRKSTKYFFQFTGYDAPTYFDDIEIKFLDPKVMPPTATGFTLFNDNGFTANWQPVDGASNYLVSLYTLLPGRDKTRSYIYENISTTDCHYTFDGLDTPHSTFYYTVKAVKDGIQSPDSEPIKVHSLTTPSGIVFSTTPDGFIEVSWDAVTGAEYYEVSASRAHTATASESFTIAEENFDKLVSPGKPSIPEYDLPINEELDEWTTQPGWVARNPAHINGAYGLIGYYYQQYGDPCYLESPIMDLSANNGIVRLTVDLYAQQIDLRDQCTSVLRCLKLGKTDKGTDRLTTTDSYETPLLEDKWETFSVKLGGGTEQSVVDICAKAGYLYIDNIKITQDLNEGDRISVPYYDGKTTANRVKIPIHDLLQGNDLEVRIRAVREIWDSGHYSVNEYVRSPFSDYSHFHVATAGICDIAADGTMPSAVIHGSTLIVKNPEATDVEVSDSLGHTIATDRSGSDRIVIELPVHGLYIIRCGGKSIKVAY